MVLSVSRVVVRAPATTANLGPGFDSIGMALEIFNTVSVEVSDRFSIDIEGHGSDTLSRSTDNMVYQGLASAFEGAGVQHPALSLACHNDIPLRRGLGSSAAAVTAGLVAGNVLCGSPLSAEDLLRMAEAVEGHPDNAAPALFGGCQIVVRDANGLVNHPIPLSRGVNILLLIPDFEIPTPEARAVLPRKVPMSDAVFNIGRAALLSAALSTGDGSALRLATQDALHQPYRAQLFPGMTKIFDAALEAGAYGVFLSGSGPAILAFVGRHGQPVAQAMLKVAGKEGVSAQIRWVKPSLTGVSVIEKVDFRP